MGVVRWGMSQVASDAWRAAGIDDSRIGQTIGNAPASAGTHAQDGVDPEGNPYCAAMDLSVKHPTFLADVEIKTLLETLARHGFAAFYRNPGSDGWPADQVRHIHAIYVGQEMKEALRAQVHDWCNHRDGLVGHAEYTFWQPSEEGVNTVRTLFLQHNPVEG